MPGIGINLGFGDLHEHLSDEDMYLHEVDLAVGVEALGYDTVWAVEHHFDDYSMCPDNFVMLAHLAGRTSTIKLGQFVPHPATRDPTALASADAPAHDSSTARAPIASACADGGHPAARVASTRPRSATGTRSRSRRRRATGRWTTSTGSISVTWP